MQVSTRGQVLFDHTQKYTGLGEGKVQSWLIEVDVSQHKNVIPHVTYCQRKNPDGSEGGRTWATPGGWGF